MRLARLIGPELETLVRENPDEANDLLEEVHPEDMADMLEDLDDERASEFLIGLPTDYAAQVFQRLDESRQEALTERMGVENAAQIVREMEADDRADYFSILPPTVVEPLLQNLERVDPEAAEEVEELSRWPETSAGGLMTTEFISVPPHITIAEAIEAVRKAAEEAETVDTVYVLDESDHLLGFLSLRMLLLASPVNSVHEAMHTNVIHVPPELDQEEVAQQLTKYDLNTLPVVDTTGELLGVITSDDIFDVMAEEQSEDVHKLGGVEPIGEGYFDASFGMYIRKRAPWLLILFVSGYITASAMEAFDDVLRAIAQLAFYLPLLISAGGNSGSQSSTLITRGLAVGDIAAGDWWRVLLRELGQGLVLGTLLAAFGIFRVLMSGDGLPLAGLVALTIVGIVVMGCVVGGMMPIVLHRFGADPATSSTPFIATLVDVLGIVIYLSLARALLMGAAAAAPAAGAG